MHLAGISSVVRMPSRAVKKKVPKVAPPDVCRFLFARLGDRKTMRPEGVENAIFSKLYHTSASIRNLIVKIMISNNIQEKLYIPKTASVRKTPTSNPKVSAPVPS